MESLESAHHIHLIGIGGCSMSGLARILKAHGHMVTGSDRELPDARKIYGQAMERIPSIGWFADAVSRLLCRQLRQG